MKGSIWLLSACLWTANLAVAQLIFKKNGNEVFRITSAGDLTFANSGGSYSENTPISAVSGELAFKETGTDAAYDASTSGNDFRVKGRFLKRAVMPTGSNVLLFKNPSGIKQAAIAPNGDFFLNDNTPSLPTPSLVGSNTYYSVVYASNGAQVIPVYQSPTSNYVTPRKDISPFFNSVDNDNWGFGASNVPLNGLIRVPDGQGPFPLALFVHGNHDPNDYSDPGYLYLCELLASHGIIAGTIDANFLNWSFGEMDARAILHLEHVKLFQNWNAQSGHPLFNKVDMGKVMIVGHSRGGEAAGIASYFNGLTQVQADPDGPITPLNGSNGLGPYGFGLQCIFAFAPTDGQYVPVGGPYGAGHNYFVMYGARDWDVSWFDGLKMFDRTHSVDLSSPTDLPAGFKALAYVTKANHNFFNTTWDQESTNTMSREDQETVAKVYVGALGLALLKGKSGYLDLVKNHLAGSEWLPSSSQYISQYQDRQRLIFNHYEEDASAETVSPPFTGSNSSSSLTATEVKYSEANFPLNLYYTTKTLRLSWSSTAGYYRSEISASAGHQMLAVRLGQNNASNNPVSTNQDCTIRVLDGTGGSASAQMSTFVSLPYPVRNVHGSYPTVLQTVRIPLQYFASQGVNPNDIREVRLQTDVTPAGTLYLDEFQLSY